MKNFQEPFGPKTEPENDSGDLKNVEIHKKSWKSELHSPRNRRKELRLTLICMGARLTRHNYRSVGEFCSGFSWSDLDNFFP